MSNVQLATDNVRNIHQRMLAVYAEVTSIQKEDKKVNNQYTFVSHDAVVKALHEPLVKNGICLEVSTEDCEQDGNRTKILMLIRFVNVDNPTNFIEVKSYGYGIDPQDKGVGKAVSYAFKTALLKNFCLESSDEDNEKSHTEYKPASAPKKAPIYITTSQIAELKSKLMQAGLDESDFLSRCKIQDFKYIEAHRFDGAIAYLSSMPSLIEQEKCQLNFPHKGAIQ